MSVEWAFRCPVLFLLWCSKRPHEMERGLQSPGNFTMVKNKVNPAHLSCAFTLQRQVCFFITAAFYTPLFIVNIGIHVASKRRSFLWKCWDRWCSSICVGIFWSYWAANHWCVDVYIADIQAGLKHLRVEELGTKWGKEKRKILLLHSWWKCKSGIVF